jgi:hypothetical protein
MSSSSSSSSSSSISKDESDDVKICQNLTSTIKNMLGLIGKKMPDNVDIDRLKQILKLAFVLDHDAIMLRIASKIWKYKKAIQEKDEKTFLSDSFGSDMIKQDEREEFLKRLLKLIKTVFKTSSNEEKNIVWLEMRKILKYVILFIKTKSTDEAKSILSNINVTDLD